MRQICCDLMIRNKIKTKLSSITFHIWLKIACELGPRSLRQPKFEESKSIMERKICINSLIHHAYP